MAPIRSMPYGYPGVSLPAREFTQRKEVPLEVVLERVPGPPADGLEEARPFGGKPTPAMPHPRLHHPGAKREVSFPMGRGRPRVPLAPCVGAEQLDEKPEAFLVCQPPRSKPAAAAAVALMDGDRVEHRGDVGP